jgi:HAD superfamily hydrolase (TIGR01509 family)
LSDETGNHASEGVVHGDGVAEMIRFRAVLFDFGDTLFSRAAGARALIETAAALGAEVAEERAQALWRSILARAITPEEMALARDVSAEAHRREWTRLYSMADEIAPGMGAALYAREIEPSRWIAHPDARTVLAKLKRTGVAIGVVSDTGWDIRPVFALAGLHELVDAFVLSFEHGAVKPAPGLFAAACDALGVAPGESLMVGDNPITDGGAVRAGLTVLLLRPDAATRPGSLDPVLHLVLAGDP